MAVALFLMAAWLTVPASRAEAKGDPHFCAKGPEGELRPTQDGGDLTIQGRKCLVKAGPTSSGTFTSSRAGR